MPTKPKGYSINAIAEALGRDRRAVTRVCLDYGPIARRGRVRLYDPLQIATNIVRLHLHGSRGGAREVWRGTTSPLDDWERARLTPELLETLRRAEALAAD